MNFDSRNRSQQGVLLHGPLDASFVSYSHPFFRFFRYLLFRGCKLAGIQPRASSVDVMREQVQSVSLSAKRANHGIVAALAWSIQPASFTPKMMSQKIIAADPISAKAAR